MSAAIVGLDAFSVEVEVDATPGLHSFSIVGLPDKTVDESKDRIGSAIKNSGFIAPIKTSKRIVVNLAPASIKKEGSSYDLPIAIGYLIATNQIKASPDDIVMVGELSLDGSLKKINGVLPIAQMAKKQNAKILILPKPNVKEAAFIDGIKIIGASNTREVINYLSGRVLISPHPSIDYERLVNDANYINNDDVNYDDRNKDYGDGYVNGDGDIKNNDNDIDLSHIKGQENAKRALIIAASGGHNIIMNGPPGGGKTILAKAFSTILPAMNKGEALEVTKIYSISGLIKNQPIITKRPFRNPHHTTSPVAVIGGGTWPRPGEITLAHRGVLFLDELPEFPRNVLEALRQPLEGGEVVVSRASGTVKFPARFMLVAAMNPCPCGNYGDEKLTCICTSGSIYKYKKKISGPILDRIDLQIEVSRETYNKMSSVVNGNTTSAQAAEIVSKAREIQAKRFAGRATLTNAEMSIKQIERHCRLIKPAEEIIKNAFVSHNLSGRSYHKILKIARTIADIDGEEKISPDHIAEAIGYRVKQGGEE